MKLLPIHPQPKDGEILSSWMARLSFSNHFQLHTFYSKLLDYKKQIWTRDIDRSATHDLFEMLSDCSGCPVSRIESMTLRLYEGLLYEDVRLNGVAKWILPMGIFHRTHRRQGLQCCALCLKEGVPYFYLKWRISIFTICEVHKCFLIDVCPECNSNIEFHRLGINGGDYLPNIPLSLCSRCGFDLSKVVPVYPAYLPERVLNDYQKLLMMIAKNQWNSSLRVPVFYPLSFFEGLKSLLTLINKRSATSLREIINKQFPIELTVKHSNAIEFGYLSISHRFKLLTTCMWLLHNWPHRLVAILCEARQSRSRVAEEPSSLPYWLLQPLDQYLDQRIYLPTHDEFMSVKNYLTAKGKVVSKRAIADLLGIGIESIRVLAAAKQLH